MALSVISSVQGVLEAVGPDWVDVGIGGVVLRVSVPASTADQLGVIGDRVRLFTSLQVREDSLMLYGFLTDDARLTFETLKGINGVGPRLALAMLSRFTPESLAATVTVDDIDAFTAVPGIGKKMASRILLELRGRLGHDWTVGPAAGEHDDVIDALRALGYTTTEAHDAASSLPPGDDVSLEDKVRLALERMGSG